MRHLLTRRIAAGLGLLALPWILGFTGAGEGQLRWTEGEGHVVVDERALPFDLVARVNDVGTVHLLATIPVPGVPGDGVLSVVVPDRMRDLGPVDLPVRGVDVRYREYGEDGEVLFRAAGVVRGRIDLRGATGGPLSLVLDVELQDLDHPDAFRRLGGLRTHIGAVEAPAESEPGSGPTVSTELRVAGDGGCDDDDWDDDDDWEDDDDWGGSGDAGSGCEGDDMGDSGGGCGGDNLGDSGGGCGGDNLGDTSGGGCQGCEGDAIAAGGGVRRSALGLRLVNLLPWGLILVAVRLMRRRAR